MLEKQRPSAIPRDAHSHLDMSEDPKSAAAKTKGGRRFLYIANPGSDESSGEEDNKRSEAESSSNPQGFNYQQPPLPSLSTQPRTAKPTRPQYAPSPLTTNLPMDHGHHYQSSRSNPTLSSPSSTSSPAVESTPPPSTPSLGTPSADLPGEASIRQEPSIGASLNERADGTHIAVRPTGLFEKFKAHLPHRSSLQQRTSTNTLISNTSPTGSLPESYTSPTTTPSSRSTPVDNLLIMVTTDADQYLAVEVHNAKNAAVIRERIFTKLHVSDEDQSQYSIYRTKIGRFALGEALTDEQLFTLCCQQGDDEGFLRFFVSHSSAQVHEVPPSATSLSPTSVSTIPPPVLPLNNAYGPLRPQRRARSRSRHGSASSASERLPPEVGAGYEASVSDDLDNGDRDAHRSTMRPPPSKSMTAAFKNFPSSPDRGRRPNAPPARPMSPLYTMRSSSPSTNTRNPGLDVPSTRVDQYGSITPTQPPAPPPLSPNCATFDGNALILPIQTRHARSGSDAAAQREQILEASENQLEKQWQQQREERGQPDKPRDRGDVVRNDRGQRDKQPSADADESSDKASAADWVLVPNDTPRAASKSQDGLRIPSSVPKERSRNQNYSPFKQAGYGPRPPIPNPPRNPPPPPPVGCDTRPGSSRGAGQAVPSKWVVGWKVPDKADQKALPVSTPQWNRLTAKSMTDLRNPAFNNHPNNLQPGQRRGNQLPVTKAPERREGVSIPIPSNAPGDASGGRESSATYLPSMPKSYEPHRTPPRPLPKQGSSSSQTALNYSQSPPHSYGMRVPPLQSPPTNGFTGLISPGGDPYPRPQSAFGNSVPSSTPQRYQNRHPTNDNEDGDTLQSPHPLSPLRQGAINGRLGFGREEGTSIPQSTSRHGLRLNPNALGTYVSTRPSDSHGGSEAPRTPPRSPASPRSPKHNSRPNTAETPGGLYTSTSGSSLPTDIADSINSNETLRQDNHHWIRQMLDGNSNSSATLVPKATDIGQSPIPVTPLPPIPSQSQNSRSQSTLVADESDSDEDGGGTLWQTKPAPKSPQSKSDKSLRGPPLTLQTDKISSTAPSSFRNNITSKASEHPVASRPPPDPPHPERRLAPLTPDSGKLRQRGSTFTDNEYTWAPRPAAEEVYNRLEDFFPEHDLDMPVIEATSGTGSPTNAEYPAAPPVPDKDRPEKGLTRGKKSIRIVAEEHKKRIDRTSRPDNLANVLRKRSTKLWGSRLEEVTTEQAKAEYTRALYAKPAPPESPSGGPRPIFKWVRGELIGKGTYGRVYLALNATTGEMIAVKQVEIPQTASDKNDSRQAVLVQALKMESEIFKDLDHPNVVQYLGFEETPNFLSIFLEYVPGGSVGSCLLKHGKFDEEVTKSFTEQILTGLEYLHSKGILHRDLKADNILVETTGVCKISDFGIAKRTDNIDGLGASTAMTGTVFWMAPEVIDPMKKGYDKKVDIWSVGCVVHEMWVGKRPWSGDEAIAVILKLHKSKLPPPIPDDVVLSPLAHNFRNKCFAINPEERPTAAELRKHPYLTLPPDWIFSGFKSDS